MNELFLSAICESAVIVDLQDYSVNPYSELEIERDTPGAHPPAWYERARAYLVFWPSGLATQLVTRLAPNQLQPDMIESLYSQATHLKPCDLSRRRKGGR